MIDTSRPVALAFLLVAGVLAGAVNGVAGGGSLLVFPALLAVGFNPLAANVTNSVVQWPGYLGQVLGNREELSGQGRRALYTSITAVLGAGVGSVLLLVLPGEVFDAVVPALVILAALMMGVGPRLKRLIGGSDVVRDRTPSLLVTMFVASVYGGYFGGALGVVLISVLSLLAHDDLRRLNALKGLLSLVVGTVTVLVFAIGGPVDWLAVALLAPTTLIGGVLGAHAARRLPQNVLRWTVVVIGIAVGGYLAVR